MKNDDFNIADYMSVEELEEEFCRINTQMQREEDERREREYLEQVEKDNEEYYKSLMEYEFNPFTMSREEMLDFINSEKLSCMLEQYSGNEKEMAIQLLNSRANDLNISSVFKSRLRQVTSELEGSVICTDSGSAEFVALLDDKLTRASNGNIEATIDNFYNIMTYDKNISQHIKFNVMSNQIEYWENGIGREWRDDDDSRLIAYIETNYGLYNQPKYLSAFNKVTRDFEYHPVKRFIEFDEWDGVPRIDNFLKDICKCKDNEEYLREVSRMIFYGGINRIYDPGCKFDYMPILVGKQGNGKSSIVKWLNIVPKLFYRELLTIEGKDCIENLNGGWICEFSELQGMVRASDLETLKGFITREVDIYRPAYGRYTVNKPRQFIFIGTTNDIAFLTDKTGNRRYLPVRVGLDKGELYDEGNLEYVKEYILQCWREAKCLMEQGKTYLSIPKEYDKYIEEAQSAAVVEDPRVGLIDKYLRSKKVGDKVCCIEIYTQCLNGIGDKMTIGQSKEIGRIMLSFDNWVKNDNPTVIENYGRQRYWKKVQEDID